MDIFAKNQTFDFGETHYPNGGRYGPIFRSHLDLFVLRRGKVTISINRKTRVIAGEHVICLINEPSMETIYTYSKDSFVWWCETGEFIVPDNAVAAFKSLPFHMKPSERLNALMEMGLKLNDEPNRQNLENLKNSIGEATFNEYFFQAHMKGEDTPLPPTVKRIKQYIEQRYLEPCSLEDIASAMNLNPRYMIRILKEHTDLTPMQYIWQLRAEKGIHLLCRSGLLISEIAYQCGFKSPYHFSNHIKSHYGNSPTKIRELSWRQDPSIARSDVDNVQY